MTRRATVERQIERDKLVIAYHVGGDPAGLKCPVCGRWSPLNLDSPQGVRFVCEHDGVVAIMPRVQLVRAIARHQKAR